MSVDNPITIVKKEFIEPYKSHLKGVIFFGSASKGINDEFSDVDLIFITDNKNTEYEMTEKAKKFGYSFDLCMVEDKEFRNWVNL